MRICLVPTMFPKYKGDYYGSFVFDEAKELVKCGLEVHVVTPHNQGARYEEIMEGIHIHRFKWLEPKPFKALVHFKGIIDSIKMISYIFSLFFKLIRINRKFKIEIIHAHSTIPTGFIGIIIAKIMRKPILITAHGMDITNFIGNPLFERIISFSLNSCDKAIAVSDDLAEKMVLLGTNKNKIAIIKNAVDIYRFKPLKTRIIREKYNIDKKDTLILFVGYLDTFKGIFEMIDAFYEVHKENKRSILMMIGEGPKKEELKNKVFKLGLQKSVIITGKVSPANIHEYYQSADIFVLPSYIDAGAPPMVFVEAMACGLPVIGTDVGGIPEGIENNKNGFVVPPKNANELANKLEILIKDKDLRKEFGNNSLKKIHENSMTLKKKAEEIINLYKNQIKNRSL